MKKTIFKIAYFFTVVVLSLATVLQSCKKNDESPSPASITDFLPKKDTVGGVVTISGLNFDATAANNQVQFNGVMATLKSATPTQLEVIVPDGAATGKISITLNGNTVQTPSDFQILKTGSKLYFSEYNPLKVSFMSPITIGTSTLIADGPNKGLLSPTGVAVASNGYVYIAEEGGNRIVRIKKDGSGTLDVLFDSGDGIGQPTSIAVNEAANTLYWNNSATDQIMKGSIDGSGAPTTLFGGAAVNDYGYGMAIDINNNKIYFSDFGSNPGFIKVGNLDGTGTPAVLFDQKNAPSLVYPSNIVIDTENGKIYWADENDGDIVSANLDGSGTPTTLFDATDGINSADGIAIDVARGKIYWSNNSESVISVGNLDGSGTPKNILTNVESYYFCMEYK